MGSINNNLTKRELEILFLISECKKNCDIAGKLNLSHHTVETHKSNLIKKLQLKNTTELIAYAIKNSEEIKSQLEKIKSK
ncbi:response regulator transcription factor [Ignavibacterium album]|uniref:response regulator transcription factor n=1 Tax=Ignavibacterium album TaxID=591197 RepID=UPI0035BAB1CC